MNEISGPLFDASAINPELSSLLRAAALARRYVRAEGSSLFLENGHRVLDFVAGYGALPFGHNPADIHAAIAAGLLDGKPCLIQPHFPDAAVHLAERLLEIAPGEFQRVVLSNSGAEAVEVALKAARMATGRHTILAMERGFHGKTRGAMSVTDMRGRDVWAGQDDGTIFVPFGDAEAVESILNHLGSDIAAIIVEPIQGEGGVHVGEPAFFAHLRALCDKHGAFLIFDEVQTGLGRSGTLFASEWTGVLPDAMALGKALGGGVMAIGATLINERMSSPTLALQHSSTFAGNKYAALAAHAFLDRLLADNRAMLANVTARGAQLQAIHARLIASFPDLKLEERGRGLLRGLEIALPEPLRAGARGASLVALHQQGRLSVLLAGRLIDEGVRVAPTLRRGSTLRVEPPLNVTAEECTAYANAMEIVLGHLAARDSASLATHIAGPVRRAAQPPLDDGVVVEPGLPAGDEGHYAFIMHPLSEATYQDFDPALTAFDTDQVSVLCDALAGTLEPFVVSSMRLQARDGRRAVGDYIVIPFTARQLMEIPREIAVHAVQKGIDMAVARGARIIGLGGYTSIVTEGGRRVDGGPAGLTTGNTFTMLAAMMAAERAGRILGVRTDCNTTAIVGATGSIGSGLIGLAGVAARRLILLVNPASPVAKSRRRLARHLAGVLQSIAAGDLKPEAGSVLDVLAGHLPDAPQEADLTRLADDVIAERLDCGIRVSDDVAQDLCAADLVLVATSSTDAFISPEMLKSGAVVCDLSRPGNISYQCREARDDVLVIDGGIIAFPERPELGVRIGMPRGVGFACMAETAMLGLSQSYADKTGSLAVDFANVTTLRGLAGTMGFELADLRAFDRPIGRIDWSGIKAQGQAGGPQDAFVVHATPADPHSIDDTACLDFYDCQIGRWLRGDGADRDAVIDSLGTRLSWAELDRRAGLAASALARAGVVAGGRAIVSGQNAACLVVAIAALWRLGACPVVVDPAHRQEVQREMIAVTGAVIAITTGDTRAMLQGMLPCLAAETLGEGETVPAAPIGARPASDEAVIAFTSGSTGRPKAVLHSLRDMVNTSVNYGRHILDLTRDDRVLSVSRLSFTYGFNAMQMAMWHGATSLIAPARFDPSQTFERIATQAPTIMFGVPTVYMLLLRKGMSGHDLSSLRLCVSAGEPLPERISDAWLARHGQQMIDGIGTTEVFSTFISNRRDTPRAGNMGRLVPGFALRLCRPDGSPALPGEAGIAEVMGNSLAHGYLGDPENSARFFRDGWYSTNDVMRCDRDGNFHYLGRANDMVKVGGVWLSTARIEAALASHPAVAECAVILKEEETPLVRPYAFVVLAEPVPDPDALAEALKEHCRASLPSGQVPHGIQFIDALPRTLNQKIERYRLASMVGQPSARSGIAADDRKAISA